jgi:hypothetical protein
LALPGEKHDHDRNGDGAPDPAPHFLFFLFRGFRFLSTRQKNKKGRQARGKKRN